MGDRAAKRGASMKRRAVVLRGWFRRGFWNVECGTCGDLGPTCRCNGLRLVPVSARRFIVGQRADERSSRR